MWKRLLRGLVGQAIAFAPDLINWAGVAVLPSLGPWAPVAGAALNAIGKAIRLAGGEQEHAPATGKEKWQWIPV